MLSQTPEVPVKPTARRLVALQYNYSDSEDEETREERKARIVSTNSFLKSPHPPVMLGRLLFPLYSGRGCKARSTNSFLKLTFVKYGRRLFQPY